MFRFFENLIDPYQPYVANDAPPRKLWPFLKMYLQPFKTIFVILGVLSVIIAGVEISLIWYLGRIVDLLATATQSSFWQENGFELALVAVAILFLRPLVDILHVALLNNALLPNVGTLVRYRAHRHVIRQSVGWFENDFAGRITNRIMQTPPAMGEVVFQVFDALTYASAYLVGAFILLYGTDVRLIAPLGLWAIGYLLLLRWMVKRVGPASKASSDARSQTTGRVVDSYTNIHAVKMFDHHNGEIEYVTEAIEHSRKTFQYEMRLFTIMDFGLMVLNGFLIVGVVGWGVYLWSMGSAEIGIVAAASALTLRLSAMTGWIMWATSSFFRELGIVEEGMETISAPIELLDKPDAKPFAYKQGAIEFRDVSHHYGKGFGGLNAVSLKVASGEKVGLVGKSGAGKSTLIKLVLRFFDPENGAVFVDGQNIKDVSQASLREQIGVVQQENSLLHRTVRENVMFGRPSATNEEMLDATQKAVATEFIEGLEDQDGNKGFEAKVGERGVKLSGGQRQRISLARVLLKDAPILILDEATAALDSEVEAEIQTALYNYMKDKTVIAIAHRLSTIAQMDRIVVLDEGQIVEEGPHESLIKKGGIYAALWQRQSGGFLIDENKN